MKCHPEFDDATSIPTAHESVDPNLEERSDEELIALVRSSTTRSGEALEELYGRYYSKVKSWSGRICGRQEEAADLTQEVFVRVHQKLDTFRMEARFSTWLYTVTRSVAINHGIAANRRRERFIEDDGTVEAVDRSPSVEERLDRRRSGDRVKREIDRLLQPLEAKIFYLHFADGLTLPAITRLLKLENKSGAKAYIVSAKRKLKRGFATLAKAPSKDTQTGSRRSRAASSSTTCRHTLLEPYADSPSRVVGTLRSCRVAR